MKKFDIFILLQNSNSHTMLCWALSKEIALAIVKMTCINEGRKYHTIFMNGNKEFTLTAK
jgi:hypothetical protein